MPLSPKTLFTIGYEGLTPDAFLALLKAHHIQTLIDIRESPISRKPGFCKNSLAHAMHNSGLHYLHMRSLGCPKAVRDGYKQDGDWQRYTAGFMQHLSTQTAAVAELSGLALASHCALLCYEADFNFCHRSMVADAVRAKCGLGIVHIAQVKNVDRGSGQPDFFSPPSF
jgi:uncharacterized protein (DUF488 family)